ncbi:MAG: NAD(P)H-hydrate dehydratase [Anaerolineaceae bacterium]|nr:NAD(P)H-hydrate dehydratase [Anaerolineaceae bacterium]
MERITRVPALPDRPASGHKGTFGTVLIVGGSRGMAGAVALAGRAALVGGAGLARLAVPGSVLDTVATMAPACTTLALPETPAGRLHPRAAVEILRLAGGADVLAVGPGLGCDSDTVMVVRAVLENVARPVVADADGLNALAAAGGLSVLTSRPETFVITPHPGEAGRLLGTSAGRVQSDREAAAGQLAAGGTVVLLKGQATIVTDGRRIYVNSTGNSGLATGGSGDVLTGLLASLIGQGMSGFEAAVLAVHLHGRAGDRAAAEIGEASLTAEEILRCLPAAGLI